jgi:hypothetical protein
MTNQVSKTDRLVAKFQEQLRFLQRPCVAFDQGAEEEADAQVGRWQNQRNEHATTTGDRRTRRSCRRHGAGPNGARLADIACSSRLSSDRATSWRASGHYCS